MSAITFPSRPTRSSSDIRREIAPSSSHAIDRDQMLPNPWIPPAFVPKGEPVDEREWLRIERNAAVSGALRARKARLLGDGVVLEPGEGDGSEELFEWWKAVLEELPMMTILDLAFAIIPRGWRPFENVGADRQIEGRQYFVPVQVTDPLSWHFRWTAGGDLIFCPPLEQPKGYRMRTLSAMLKWWAPKAGSLSNRYGYPMHADYQERYWSFTELSDAGLVQIKQAAGFLKVKTPFALGKALSSGEVERLSQLRTAIEDMMRVLQATGVLVEGDDMLTEWVSLVAAIDKWISLFRWFDDVARGFYQGGNLSTMVSGATGSLAAGEVQERQGLSLAAVDGTIIEQEFRAGWLRPWSARNAAIIAPAAFPGVGMTPRLEDVPLVAVPRLSFAALHKIRPEDLELLRLFTEIGVIDAEEASEEVGPGDEEAARPADRLARIDADHHLRMSRWRLLAEGEAGATLDLARKEMPAALSPAVPGALPDDPDEEEPENPEEQDPQARRQASTT